MKKERQSIYTYKVPLEFKFKASSDIDLETLDKMAMAYLDLVVASGKFDVSEKELHLAREEVIYTPEEIAERKERLIASDLPFPRRGLWGRL